jgi:ketosteroid isomerase-like protein
MRKNSIVTAITCISLLLGSTVCKAQHSSPSGVASIRKAIEVNNALYYDLFVKKDSAIVDLYTEDGCLQVPNEPPKYGRAALIKDFTSTFADGTVKGVKFQTKDIYGDGKQYVTEEGTWEVFDPNGKLLDDGKYLKLWKKTPYGWKIFRDIFNSNHKAQP